MTTFVIFTETADFVKIKADNLETAIAIVSQTHVVIGGREW